MTNQYEIFRFQYTAFCAHDWFRWWCSWVLVCRPGAAQHANHVFQCFGSAWRRGNSNLQCNIMKQTWHWHCFVCLIPPLHVVAVTVAQTRQISTNFATNQLAKTVVVSHSSYSAHASALNWPRIITILRKKQIN